MCVCLRIYMHEEPPIVYMIFKQNALLATVDFFEQKMSGWINLNSNTEFGSNPFLLRWNQLLPNPLILLAIDLLI